MSAFGVPDIEGARDGEEQGSDHEETTTAEAISEPAEEDEQ